MSSPSSEQNDNEPEQNRESQRASNTQQSDNNVQQTFARAEAAQGAPVSIIPVAPMHWRMLAFLLDGVLIGLFAILLLSKVLLPQYHPVGYSEYITLIETRVAEFEKAQQEGAATPLLFPAPDEFSEQVHEMLFYCMEIVALCLLVYFVLCEQLMGGGSIGKSMFRLRVISLNTGRPPNVWESFLRGIIKASLLASLLLPLLSLLFVVSYLLPFGNRMRRAGHDWLAHTLVVSDVGGYVPHIIPPRKRAEEDDDY